MWPAVPLGRRFSRFGSLRAIDQEPLESRQKMNSEMLHKSHRFANVGAPPKHGLPEDPEEKKAAIAKHMEDRKKAQTSKEVEPA
mgnify:FL=1